jgi:hypothetical protein
MDRMKLKAGNRLRSTVCSTEVVVVKGTDDDVDLRCGGAPMAAVDQPVEAGAVRAGFDAPTLIGKRYTDAAATFELLCSKAGAGSLSVGDTLLGLKEAKPLPSSD